MSLFESNETQMSLFHLCLLLCLPVMCLIIVACARTLLSVSQSFNPFTPTETCVSLTQTLGSVTAR